MAVATHGHASGWRASDLRGGKDDLRVALGPAHLEELDGALSTLRRSAEARTGIAPVTLENLRQEPHDLSGGAQKVKERDEGSAATKEG